MVSLGYSFAAMEVQSLQDIWMGVEAVIFFVLSAPVPWAPSRLASFQTVLSL